MQSAMSDTSIMEQAFSVICQEVCKDVSLYGFQGRIDHLKFLVKHANTAIAYALLPHETSRIITLCVLKLTPNASPTDRNGEYLSRMIRAHPEIPDIDVTVTDMMFNNSENTLLDLFCSDMPHDAARREELLGYMHDHASDGEEVVSEFLNSSDQNGFSLEWCQKRSLNQDVIAWMVVGDRVMLQDPSIETLLTHFNGFPLLAVMDRYDLLHHLEDDAFMNSHFQIQPRVQMRKNTWLYRAVTVGDWCATEAQIERVTRAHGVYGAALLYRQTRRVWLRDHPVFSWQRHFEPLPLV
jgi:hypothetical protein